jgi:hypothetical protein
MERWVFLSLHYYQHDLSEIQGDFPDNIPFHPDGGTISLTVGQADQPSQRLLTIWKYFD